MFNDHAIAVLLINFPNMPWKKNATSINYTILRVVHVFGQSAAIVSYRRNNGDE